MGMMLINSLKMSREMVAKAVSPGDTVIDATCGKGRDTLLLAEMVGPNGRVFSFDIQEAAVSTTRNLVDSKNYKNVKVIKDSHSNMDEYVDKPVSCVMFNLGYLPGSDHTTQTKSATTITAIEKSMELLGSGGLISIVIYHGGDTGYDERDAVLSYCSTIDQSRFTVEMRRFINQKNDPPILILIEKQ